MLYFLVINFFKACHVLVKLNINSKQYSNYEIHYFGFVCFVFKNILQLTEGGVTTEIGQLVQKNVEEENKQEKESVTTLPRKMEERTVREAV